MIASETLFIAEGDALIADIPEIVMFGDARHRSAEQELIPHYNTGIEICLCRSGVYRWDVEGESVEIRPGEPSITLPWELHSGQNNLLGPGRLNWIVVPAAGSGDRLVAPILRKLLSEDVDALLAACTGLKTSFVGAIEGTSDLFDTIRDEILHDRPGRRTAIRSAIALLLVHVVRRLGGIPDERSPSVPGLVLAVLQHVLREPAANWTTVEMADRAGLGVTAFTDWCRRATGRTPRWYVLDCRLEQARMLLVNSQRSVTHIALELGFSSLQHFSSSFRQLYGESPSGFRARTTLGESRKR